jgi:phosphatidylinositol alpha-mannosyltransferase
MRIALLAPTYWPEVRRGSERVVHDLGVTLAERGHDVTLLTTHPGPPEDSREEGMRVRRARRLPRPPGLAAHEYHLTGIPQTFLRLVRGGFDVAQTFFPTDSWAAVHARRHGGPPVVATTHGIPVREYLVARRYRLDMHLAVARRAEACAVLSAAAAAPYERFLLRRPEILPAGVLPGAFAADAPRAEAPTLFCASSLGDPRKRAGLLFAAFSRLREGLPEARLRVARPRDPFMSGALPELPAGAEWVDTDSPGAMAREYASAWATVNPAVGEAFGLVLVESLAAGTPAVGDTSGAAPEILDERVGRLFGPDDEGDLARALGEALDLGADAAARDACRARAAEFDWPRIVGSYERVYRRVATAH